MVSPFSGERIDYPDARTEVEAQSAVLYTMSHLADFVFYFT